MEKLLELTTARLLRGVLRRIVPTLLYPACLILLLPLIFNSLGTYRGAGADEHPYMGRKPAKGTFLIASDQLLDPNFSQTVVFLLEYSSEGAVGLIINRRTEVRLSEVLPEIRGLRRRKDVLYIGGPVGIDQMMLLVWSEQEPDDSYRIIEDVYVCSNIDEIGRVVKSEKNGDDFRAYVGYSGWAPGQLDGEIGRGDWLIVPADAKSIFSNDPEALWPKLIERGSAQWTRAIVIDLDVVRVGGPSGYSRYAMPAWD
jgi:putative transcriptional regulator